MSLRLQGILVGEGRVLFRFVVYAYQARAVELPIFCSRIELEFLPRRSKCLRPKSEGLEGKHRFHTAIVLGDNNGLAYNDISQLITSNQPTGSCCFLTHGFDRHNHHSRTRIENGALYLMMLYPRDLTQTGDIAKAWFLGYQIGCFPTKYS